MDQKQGLDPRFFELLHHVCQAMHLAAEIGSPEIPPEEKEERLFTRKEAAQFMSMSASTFDRYRQEYGLKPSVTYGQRGIRFSQVDLERFRNQFKTTSSKDQ